jgi:hypothetical protein
MFRPPGWIQIKQIIHKKLIESFLITVSRTTPWAWMPMGRQST